MIYDANDPHRNIMTMRGNGLGSLGQDLTDDTGETIDLSYDTGSLDAGAAIDTSFTSPDSSSLTASTSLPAFSASGSDSSSSSNPFSSLLTGLFTGVATAGAAVLTSTVQTAALQQTNANRLAQGLPPLSATGAVMTAAQMAAAGYSSAQVAAVQSQLAPETSTLFIIGAVVIGAVLLMGSKRSG
jgi:hypothetical protein